MATESISPSIEPVHPSRQLYAALQLNRSIDTPLAGTLSTFGQEILTYQPLRRAFTNAGYAAGGTPDTLALLRGRAAVKSENFHTFFERAVELASLEKLETPHYNSGFGQTFPDLTNLSRQVQYSTSAVQQYTLQSNNSTALTDFTPTLNRSIANLYQASAKLGPGVPSLRSNFTFAA
ncbi:hypothetical protein Mmc1_2341 [Magnetococcus marinus MC-1]|uniref:Uncharacterized protein n=1 Tax=Magnetococcus marinus (strain ATCC BAA-1437 / JCM 17883 / MC-1) TaxID=156889 RepID=A0LA48_MAGMM|nr:hypothetical protein [Magnetococcus marinus]ABK44841.1 hypothetical protein Mmc1_2341 [Magnetococcus marinus MC-1]